MPVLVVVLYLGNIIIYLKSHIYYIHNILYYIRSYNSWLAIADT